MSRTLEFFFDVVSPYSYLVAEVVGAAAARVGVDVRWRPFFLGGVFKATGNQPPALLPARGAYLFTDLGRWARHYGLPFKLASHFPANTLLAMRALMAAPEEERSALALALFRAYWVHDRNVADAAVVREALGVRGEALVLAAETAEAKDALRANTDEAVARGAFGAPTFFVGDELFWGNDRLDFALQAAARST